MGKRRRFSPAACGPVSVNYFNYFTEIEEHFQRARGTGLFLLSPLDWALIEAWKNGGIPLEAVLRGIDVAFEKWRKRPAQARIHMVNSLAYCAQAITAEAQAMAERALPRREEGAAAPFPIDDIRAFLTRNAEALRKAGQEESRRRSNRWTSTRSTPIWSNWSSGSPRSKKK